MLVLQSKLEDDFRTHTTWKKKTRKETSHLEDAVTWIRRRETNKQTNDNHTGFTEPILEQQDWIISRSELQKKKNKKGWEWKLPKCDGGLLIRGSLDGWVGDSCRSLVLEKEPGRLPKKCPTCNTCGDSGRGKYYPHSNLFWHTYMEATTGVSDITKVTLFWQAILLNLALIYSPNIYPNTWINTEMLHWESIFSVTAQRILTCCAAIVPKMEFILLRKCAAA